MQTFVPALVALTAGAVALEPVPGLAAGTVAEALTELAARPSGGASDIEAEAVPLAPIPGLAGADVQAALATLAANRAPLPARYEYVAAAPYAPPAEDVVLDVVAYGFPQQITIPAGRSLAQAAEAINGILGDIVARAVDGRLAFRGALEIDLRPSSRAALDALGIADSPHLVPMPRVADTQAKAIAVSVPGLFAKSLDDALATLAARPALPPGGTVAAPYRVESIKRAVVPAEPAEVQFVADGQTIYVNVDPSSSLNAIAAAINASIGATVVSVTGVYESGPGGGFFPNAGFLFRGTRTLDFTGTSAEGLAVLGLSLEFPLVYGLPVGIVASTDTSPSPVNTDVIEDRSTSARTGPSLTATLQSLREEVEGLRAEFDAYRAAHP